MPATPRTPVPRPPGVLPGPPPPWSGPAASGLDVGVDAVRAALARRGPGRPPLDPVPGARAASVLVPLFEEGGRAWVVLTRRTETLATHRGEVAFPGGRRNPGEGAVAAALREAREEIGLDPATVEVVGELDRLATIVSGFEVAPFVGVVPARPAVDPNPHEIARVFDVALADLAAEGVYHQEVWPLPWGDRDVHFFEVAGELVWGLTARILHQLLCAVAGVPAGVGRPL